MLEISLFQLKSLASLSLWLSPCLPPGEDELSFAYDGRGKKVSGGTEEEFGEPLLVGDIIGCYAVRCTFLSTVFETLLSRCLVTKRSSFRKVRGHFFFSNLSCVCVCLCVSLSLPMVLLSSLSIKTVVSWVWPFHWVPLVAHYSLTSSVRAVQSDFTWTPQLLPGTPVLQGFYHWHLFLLHRGCAPYLLRPPEHSVRWEAIIWFPLKAFERGK